ncbi:MAG: hypothetical protein FWF20_11185 [Betaproteobacteria bacterium]|nr:hypothetical protein [Betaproteobacteria bacterium]MCL2887315.1 hypothetical protein [Betaproteobacteria bacterium]
MAIQSVSAGNPFMTSSTTAQTQQAQQAQQTQQTRQAQQPQPQQRVERTEEAPKPVTNAQGQRTGTMVNTVA